MIRTFTIAAALSLTFSLAQAQAQTQAQSRIETASGQIASTSVPEFVDCMMDGFDATLWPFRQTTVRQQRRANGYRVEVRGVLAMIDTSADINDNGQVKLHEIDLSRVHNNSNRNVDTSAPSKSSEQKVFRKCLEQYTN